MIEKTHFTCL